MMNNQIEHKYAAVLFSKIEFPKDISLEDEKYYLGVINSRIKEHNGFSILLSKNEIKAWFPESSEAVNFAINIFLKFSKDKTNKILVSSAICFGEILIEVDKVSGEVLNSLNEILMKAPFGLVYISNEIKNKIKHKLNLEIIEVENEKIFSINPENVLNNLESSLKKLNIEANKKTLKNISENKVTQKKVISPIVLFSIFIIIISILKILGIW